MTLGFIEYLCGPWVSRDCVFSEFGNSTFILSTIEYDYVACFCDHCIQKRNAKDMKAERIKLIEGIHGSNSEHYYRSMKRYNRSIMWKFGCPGSHKYAKRSQSRHQKLTKQVSKSQLDGFVNASNCDERKMFFPSWVSYVMLYFLLVGDVLIRLVNGSVDLWCFICIFFSLIGVCTRFALDIIMGLGYCFIWDVWLGKYSEKQRHSIGHPRGILNVLFGTMNPFKPFFVKDLLGDSGGGACTVIIVMLVLWLISMFVFFFLI